MSAQEKRSELRATQSDMTDAEIVQKVRRWLSSTKERDMDRRWLLRVCTLAERHVERHIAPSAVAVDSPQTWVAAEKAKLDAYEDAARSVEKLAEDYTHEHGSYDGSTNAWELHHRHAEYIEALDAAVEAIRKRKAEKCHITKAKAL